MNSKKKTIPLLRIVLVCIIIAGVLFTCLQAYKRGWFEKGAIEGAKIVKKIPLLFTSTINDSKTGLQGILKTKSKIDGANNKPKVAKAKKKDQAELLNDKGVDLILKRRYWQGMFLLQKSIEIDDTRIEPILNMALTLQELGLTKPATRYFTMAEVLDDEHPTLQRNYRILIELYDRDPNGISDEEWLTNEKNLSGSQQLERLWGLDSQN